MSIGGNVYAALQVKQEGEKNAIGEAKNSWSELTQLHGWLDLSTGDSKHTNFNAKVQESTHIFLCDYHSLSGATSENARLVVDGLVYEILLIDDPMGMHQHLELYLRYVGGGQGVS